MIIALALLIAQEISPPEPPPWPPRYTTRQGGVIVVRLDAETCRGPIHALGRSYACRPDHTVIIGADTALAPDTYEATDATGRTVFHIAVGPTAWVRRTLPPGRSTFPPAQVLEDESKMKEAAYTAHLGPQGARDHVRLPFWAVVDRQPPVSDPFGVRRMFQILGGTSFTEIHKGTDLAVVQGTPVRSMAAGVVVIARFMQLEGNTVIIHHGDGVYTAYCHLSRVNVATNDRVSGGQRIGLSGATPKGRGLRPHLHWAMRIDTAYVDPVAGAATLTRLLY